MGFVQVENKLPITIKNFKDHKQFVRHSSRFLLAQAKERSHVYSDFRYFCFYFIFYLLI